MVWVPIPYPDSERLVYLSSVHHTPRGYMVTGASLPDARDWSAASWIDSLATFQMRPMAISGVGEPQHAAESPEAEARVAIVSHELWQGLFNGGAVLGRDIRLDGRNYTVVGVMPAGFEFLYQPVDVWLPLSLEREQRERSWRGLEAIARLKQGPTVEPADAEVRTISERLEKENSSSNTGRRGTVKPIARRQMGAGAKEAAFTMLGAVGFVLLIACANVASLLLARGTLRRREFAVRAALGAGRGALIRLQLAESLLLSFGGGLAAFAAAYWTIPFLKAMAPPETVFKTASLDSGALAFGFGLALLTAVIFGLVPAVLLTRGNAAPGLRDADRSASRGRYLALRSLVAGEIALALVLVAAGTVMIRTFVRQSNIDPGFDKTNLVAAQILLPPARYPDKQDAVAFFSEVVEKLRASGAVQSATVVQTIPLGGSNSSIRLRVDGSADPELEQNAGSMIIGPGYFAAMGIPLVAGREFADADGASSAKRYGRWWEWRATSATTSRTRHARRSTALMRKPLTA